MSKQERERERERESEREIIYEGRPRLKHSPSFCASAFVRTQRIDAEAFIAVDSFAIVNVRLAVFPFPTFVALARERVHGVDTDTVAAIWPTLNTTLVDFLAVISSISCFANTFCFLMGRLCHLRVLRTCSACGICRS